MIRLPNFARRFVLSLNVVGLLSSFAARVYAEDEATVEAPPVMPAVTAEAAPAEAPSRSSSAGRGVALGYENGLWGPLFAQALRVRVPLHEHWGLVTKGLFVHGDAGDEWRGDAGGRLELYGCSPIIAGFARLYDGGGMHVMRLVSGPGSHQVATGGGGHFGFELFQKQSLSWILEVGGGSGFDGRGTGGTVVAGLQWYPGS